MGNPTTGLVVFSCIFCMWNSSPRFLVSLPSVSCCLVTLVDVVDDLFSLFEWNDIMFACCGYQWYIFTKGIDVIVLKINLHLCRFFGGSCRV